MRHRLPLFNSCSYQKAQSENRAVELGKVPFTLELNPFLPLQCWESRQNFSGKDVEQTTQGSLQTDRFERRFLFFQPVPESNLVGNQPLGRTLNSTSVSSNKIWTNRLHFRLQDILPPQISEYGVNAFYESIRKLVVISLHTKIQVV